MTTPTEFKLISPVCPQHKLFLETREEELTLDGVQVKPGDALSTIVVPVWSKLTLHAVITRDGLSVVWRVASIETDLARASVAQAAKELADNVAAMVAKMAELTEENDDTDDNGMEAVSRETGEAPVSAPEHGN